MCRRRISLLLILLSIFYISSAYASDKLTVKLTGVPKSIYTEVRKNLSLVKNPNYVLSANVKIQTAFRDGIEQIKNVLKSYGYFEADAHGNIKYDANQKTWKVLYHVTLGSPLKITKTVINIDGSGKNLKAFYDLICQSKIHPGDTLTKKAYDDLKNGLQNTASDFGFYDAQLTQHQIIVNLDTYTAKVIVTLKTGPRYRFGKIYLSQTPDKLEDRFVRRFLTFQPDELYYQSKINQSYQNLSSGNYFQTINISPHPDKKTKEVPVNVTLVPQRPFQYSFGIGYGTDTGLRGMLGWKWRFVTRSGQYITASTQLSKIYTLYNVSYVIPGTNPLYDSTSIDAISSNTSLSRYSADQQVLGVNFARYLSQRWLLKLGLNQHFIRYTINDSTGKTNVKYLTPNFYISYTRQFEQSGYYWKNGYRSMVSLTGAAKNPLSSTTFIQPTFQSRQSLNLSENNRIFLRELFGLTQVSNFNALSPTYRFFVGGLNTVRGLSYYSKGPTDSKGNVIGGRNLMVGNANFEHHFFDKWSGGVFYDTGSAFNHLHQVKFYDSVGISISWLSPLGPINLYLAHPLNVPGQFLGFDISIGSFI